MALAEAGMACCWDKLDFDGPILTADGGLQDHRWWEAGGGKRGRSGGGRR